MAPPDTFKCLRCGHCCTHLHTKTDPARGLGIRPGETMLFPKKYIIPDWGVGKHPDHKDFRIIMYQLTEDRCPHYTDERCAIYSKRPLHCKAYPITVIPIPPIRTFMIEPEPECTWSKKIREKYPDRPPANIVPLNSEEFRAAYEVNQLGIKIGYLYGNLQSWTFDVVKREWVKDTGEDVKIDKKIEWLIKDAAKARLKKRIF